VRLKIVAEPPRTTADKERAVQGNSSDSQTSVLENRLLTERLGRLIEISIPDGQDYHSGLEEFNAHEGVMKHTTTAQL